MGNTVVNITGDLVGTKIVHNTNKEKLKLKFRVKGECL